MKGDKEGEEGEKERREKIKGKTEGERMERTWEEGEG